MNEAKFELPRQLEKLIATLAMYYGEQGKTELQRLLVNSAYRVEEGLMYDNWNGGMDGHAVYLQVPGSLYLAVLEKKGTFETEICERLNSINVIECEYIGSVALEVQNDPTFDNWRKKSGVLQDQTPLGVAASDDQLGRLWRPGYLRLFLSHKAHHKEEVSKFKIAAEAYGLTCFVAHEDIEPTKEWQSEIETALFSMDALVAFLTADFHDSSWTDQEIGVAIGLRVSIIPIRLGTDPYGFIGKYQAVQGTKRTAKMLVEEIYDLLWAKPNLEHSLSNGLVTAFENSANFGSANTTVEYLKLISQATPALIERLERAQCENPQVQGAYAVKRELPGILRRLRGEP